jgi:hypothetical protein
MALDDYRRNQDNDVRLVDFLDDKLQAFADFDTLDSLLDSVKAQQDLLKQQVRDEGRHVLIVAFVDYPHSLMMPVTITTPHSKPRTNMPLRSSKKAQPSSGTNRTSTAVFRLSPSQRPVTMHCRNSRPAWLV